MRPHTLIKPFLPAACLVAGATRLLCGQIVDEVLDAPALYGNLLGDSTRRSVLVYLPPGYQANTARRYPVVYLLHRYGATNRSWLGEAGYEGMDLELVLDSLIESRSIEPVRVVMPDATNRFGGSWYTDSSVTGHWERFLASDLVGFIDQKYRTREHRRSRGIAGQSMGGYGALRIAMHHPDVFGVVLAMSAPNLVNPDPHGAAAHEAALSLEGARIDQVPLLGRVLWSKAAAFSPNPTAPPLYADLPFQRSSAGIVRRDLVWEKWLENTLTTRVPAHAESLRDLHIRLEVGNRDALRGESMAFARALTDHGLPFSLIVCEGGHVEGVRRQFETSVFRFFDRFFNER